MTTTTASPSAAGRTALVIVAGGLVAAGASTAIALVAPLVGADPGFPAIKPMVFLPFVVLGYGAAVAGWAIVRSRSTRPAALLRVLVPVLTVLSLVPDVVLAATGFIPGTTVVGAVALGLMHLTVVGVAVPVLARALPVR